MSPEDCESNSKENDNINRHILKQALVLSEVTAEIKERCLAGEKYINYFKAMINGAEKALNALHITSKSSFELINKLLEKNIDISILTDDLRQDYDHIQGILREYSDMKNFEENIFSENLNIYQLAEKIKSLETKRKCSENTLHVNTSSTRSLKNDIDEKYPENLSRESLIDLNSVVNLPPVPEDIFTSFSNNKPTRTSSLSSLKSMRKIKLFLQKAESSDDEDSSENEEHDYSRLVYGDSDESKTSSCHSPSGKKLHLGYIKEETQD